MGKYLTNLIPKMKYPKQKILATLLLLAVVGLMYIFNAQCPFISLFNIPCLGCGMTRAVRSALNFDFVSAFRYNAMFWALPVMYLYFLCDGRLFRNKWIDFTVWAVILSGFVINWLYHLILVL